MNADPRTKHCVGSNRDSIHCCAMFCGYTAFVFIIDTFSLLNCFRCFSQSEWHSQHNNTMSWILLSLSQTQEFIGPKTCIHIWTINRTPFYSTSVCLCVFYCFPLLLHLAVSTHNEFNAFKCVWHLWILFIHVPFELKSKLLYLS